MATGAVERKVTMREHTIVTEDAGSHLSACVLGLEGCVTTGGAVEDVREEMREAIEGRRELMVEASDDIPEPLALVGTATIAV